MPDAEFHVVGSNMTDEVRAVGAEGIRLVGYAPDLDPVLEGRRVFVAPLRYGAGVKGKVGQSLGAGLPVVTTSIGAEGLGLVNAEHALIADDPLAFADAVVRLYTDPELWRHLSRMGVEHIASTMSVQAASATVRKMLTVI